MVLNFGPGLCPVQAGGSAARRYADTADAVPVCPGLWGPGDPKRSEAKAGNQMAYSFAAAGVSRRLSFWEVNKSPLARDSFWLRESCTFDLICGGDFYLRLSSVELNRPDDADGFPLKRGQPFIIRHGGTGGNKPSEGLTWIFASEINK